MRLHRTIITRGDRMANVVITMKILPDSPERNLDELGKIIEKALIKFGKIYKKSVQPIAFGINAMIFSVIMEEKAGGTDPIENEVRKIKGLGDVEVTDVTRIVDVRDL